MAQANKPLSGPRRFQWNAGGWFGASLGSSAWMVVTSCFEAVHDQPLLALIPAVGFTIVLIASLTLWARRNHIYPFTAMMWLLGLIAIVIPFVWIAVTSYGSEAALSAMNWPVSAWAIVLVSSVAPALILWFLVLERSSTPTDNDRSRHDSTMA